VFRRRSSGETRPPLLPFPFPLSPTPCLRSAGANLFWLEFLVPFLPCLAHGASTRFLFHISFLFFCCCPKASRAGLVWPTGVGEASEKGNDGRERGKRGGTRQRSLLIFAPLWPAPCAAE